MATYIGYFAYAPSFTEATEANAREASPQADPKFLQTVAGLPAKLPSTCKMLGTWSAMITGPVFGPALPGVTIVETDNVADLAFISSYYMGYLNFQWHPANVLPASAAGREQWKAELEADGAALAR